MSLKALTQCSISLLNNTPECTAPSSVGQCIDEKRVRSSSCCERCSSESATGWAPRVNVREQRLLAEITIESLADSRSSSYKEGEHSESRLQVTNQFLSLVRQLVKASHSEVSVILVIDPVNSDRSRSVHRNGCFRQIPIEPCNSPHLLRDRRHLLDWMWVTAFRWRKGILIRANDLRHLPKRELTLGNFSLGDRDSRASLWNSLVEVRLCWKR
jgi:hypothetical protein